MSKMSYSSPHLLSSSKAFLSPKGNWNYVEHRDVFLDLQNFSLQSPRPCFVLLFCHTQRCLVCRPVMRQNPYLSSRNTDTLTHFHSFCSGLAKMLWWFECDRLWRFKNSPCLEAVVVTGQKNMIMTYHYHEFIATVDKGRNSDMRKKCKHVTELQCFRSGFPHLQNEDTGEIISEISSRFRWFILPFKVKLHCFV